MACRTLAERVAAAARTGEPLVLSEPPEAVGESFAAHHWPGPVDGAALAEALTNLPEGAAPLVTIVGALVDGPVPLSFAEPATAVCFDRCLFTGPLWVNDARAHTLVVDRSVVVAVDAGRMHCEQFLMRSSLILGLLNLSAAVVGRAQFQGTAVLAEDDDHPNALAVDGNVLTSKRSLNFNRNFLAVGRSRFIGAHVGGQLNFRGARLLRNHLLDGDAPTDAVELLARHRATAAALRSRFGLVDPPESRTGFHDPSRTGDQGVENCLSLHEAVVERAVYLQEAVCIGRVNMSASRIARLRATGASFHAPEALAVDANNATVDRDFDVRGARLSGRIRINGGSVGQDVDCEDLQASSPGDGPVLSLEGAQVSGQLIWRNVKLPDSVRLNLSHATLGRLADDKASWPKGASVDLTGLSCSSVSFSGETDVKMRTAWLRENTPSYSPDAYQQLVSVARAQGREKSARTLAIASERDRRRRGGLDVVGRVGSWLLDVTVSYGYRSSRALALLGVVAALGWPVYRAAWHDRVIRHDERAITRCTEDTPCFSELVFSIDTVVPVLDLRQTDSWFISGEKATPYELFHYGQIGVGWVLTTAVVAGVGRRLQR